MSEGQESVEFTGIPPAAALLGRDEDYTALPPVREEPALGSEVDLPPRAPAAAAPNDARLAELAFGDDDEAPPVRIVKRRLPAPTGSNPYAGHVQAGPSVAAGGVELVEAASVAVVVSSSQQLAKRAPRLQQQVDVDIDLFAKGEEEEGDGSDNGKNLATKAQRKEVRMSVVGAGEDVSRAAVAPGAASSGGGDNGIVGISRGDDGDNASDDDDVEQEDDGDDNDDDEEEGGKRRRRRREKGRQSSRRRAKGRKHHTSIGKIFSGMYIDFRQCIKTADLEDCFPVPETPKECRDLLCTRQGRARAFRPVVVYFRALRQALSSRSFWRSPAPVICAGILLSLFLEGSNFTPRYNTMTILVLLAATEFPHFPPKSVRPQLTLSVATGLTVTLDIFYVLANPWLQSAGTKTLIAVASVCKVVALYTYLRVARNTLRARKYLVRRVRLFGLPLSEPRRIMRDVRARFMALALLQGFVCVAVTGLFIAVLTNYGYSELFVSSRASGVSLPTFLLIKAVTSGALFVGLALDCDPVLVLAYFGCLGWCMRFVKDYTRRKRIELGGWPYPFFYNETRHGFLLWGKAVDMLWGVVGWVTVGTTFGTQLANMEGSLKTVLVLVILVLALSDIWVPLLLAGVSWLLRRKKSLEDNEVLSDSDDSELDELEIRDPRTIVFPRKKGHRGPADNKATARERRRRLRLSKEARAEGDLSGPLGLALAAKKRKKAELRRVGRVGRDDQSESENESASDSDSDSESESESKSGSESDGDVEAEKDDDVDDSVFDLSFVDNPVVDASQQEQFSSRRAAGGSKFANRGAVPGIESTASPRIDPSGPLAELGVYARESTLEEVLEQIDGGADDEGGGPLFVAKRSIAPEAFMELWARLRVSVEFSAPVAPVPGLGLDAVSAHALSAHLSRLGFYVVASRDGDRDGDKQKGDVFRVFAFSAGARLASPRGALRGSDSGADIAAYCLFEFTLTASDARTRWSLACVAKCTREVLGPEFVALLLLGDLFELL